MGESLTVKSIMALSKTLSRQTMGMLHTVLAHNDLHLDSLALADQCCVLHWRPMHVLI